MTEASKKTRRPYETPRVTVYSESEILAGIGPALAVYGGTGATGP